jgi:hypothetical protein
MFTIPLRTSAFSGPFSMGAMMNPANLYYGVWHGDDAACAPNKCGQRGQTSTTPAVVVQQRPALPEDKWVPLTGIEGGMVMAALAILFVIVMKLSKTLN